MRNFGVDLQKYTGGLTVTVKNQKLFIAELERSK